MATEEEIRAVLEQFEINPYGPGMSMGDEDRIRTLAAALADSERERDDYNRRYETSHATRLHAEAALERVERERDEAESDMAAANITIRRLSAKLARAERRLSTIEGQPTQTLTAWADRIDAAERRAYRAERQLYERESADIRMADDFEEANAKLVAVVEVAEQSDHNYCAACGERKVMPDDGHKPDCVLADLPTAARKLLDEREALRAEVEALREDKARLDFIGEHCGGDGVLDWHFGTSGKVRICVGNDYQDLRAAIDAARGKKKPTRHEPNAEVEA